MEHVFLYKVQIYVLLIDSERHSVKIKETGDPFDRLPFLCGLWPG